MITYEFAFILGGFSLLIFWIIGLIRKMSKEKIITVCIFIVYLTLVACITLFPILYDEKVEYWGDITWYNFIPFGTISNMFSGGLNITAIVQIAGNVCMSVPYGIFVMIFIKNKKWWKLLILAFIFTISIEALQFVIGTVIDNMYRTIDIDDVILNALGAYIGYGLYKILPKNIKNIITV